MMKVRFVMYPTEVGFEQVYTRLFAIEKERRVAAVIQRLLGYLDNFPTLPPWFTNLPVAEINTNRPRTVRLQLDARDVDLAPVVDLLTPMSEPDRIRHIKRVFAAACGSQTRPQSSPQTSDSGTPIFAPTELTSAPPLSDGEAEKARKIKQASAMFSRR